MRQDIPFTEIVYDPKYPGVSCIGEESSKPFNIDWMSHPSGRCPYWSDTQKVWLQGLGGYLLRGTVSDETGELGEKSSLD